MVDYSKWDKMDLDAAADAVSTPASTESAASKNSTKSADGIVKKPSFCANCRAEGAKLRCKICKKVVYCSRNCQKSDWRFHKRICKKPEKKKKEDKRPKKDGAGAGAGAGAGEAASSSSTAPKKKSTTKKVDETVKIDEDDEELVKSMRGYHYFHKDVAKHEAKAPELVEAKAIPEDDEPKLMTTQASVWNNGNTWEERDLTKWAKAKLEELLVGASQDIVEATAEVKELTDWDGCATVPVVRGKPRYLYDFKFKAKIDIKSGAKTTKAEVEFVEFCQDEEECLMRLTWGKPKPSEVHQAALRSVMNKRDGQLYRQFHALLQEFVLAYKAK